MTATIVFIGYAILLAGLVWLLYVIGHLSLSLSAAQKERDALKGKLDKTEIESEAKTLHLNELRGVMARPFIVALNDQQVDHLGHVIARVCLEDAKAMSPSSQQVH